MKTLIIIPARGGSKGIPRKNIRLMSGQPLIGYSIKTALNSKFNPDVIVSTDDEEISRVSKYFGAQVLDRPEELAADQITLDPVISHAVTKIEVEKNIVYDYIITMQPTSPLLTSSTLDLAIDYFIQNDLDTLISGINRPHLSWTEKNGEIIPQYTKRLNRQYLPKNLEETGSFVITKRGFVTERSRLGPNISIYELSESESIDIDSPQDWWIAEKELSKKTILIRTDGYAEIGLGHIYRCLLLAYNLIDHDIRFILSKKSDLGIEKIKESHFHYDIIESDLEITELIEKYNCEVLINDMLNTSKEYVEACKQYDIKVVNFEDLGEGAPYADVVINDLYEKSNDFSNHYWGSDYYCIRDEFLLTTPIEFREKVSEILVIFGGTDPSNLTKKIFNVIQKINDRNNDIHYTFIVGMGYKYTEELKNEVEKSGLNIDVVRNVKHMSEYMNRADLAFSSQGRTMLELASMAVPTILLAQNKREQEHEFGYIENGFINLGLGVEIEEKTVKETLLWLINSPQIRKQINQQMLRKRFEKWIKKSIKANT